MSTATIAPNRIIEFLNAYGHLRYPFGQEQDVPSDLSILTLKDRCVQEAVRSHQSLDANYYWLTGVYHQRPLIADGHVGPVTEFMVQAPRCGMPDYGAAYYGAAYETEPAIGSGSWKGCHNIGDFHCAKILQMNSPPDFLAPVWDAVKADFIAAYEEIGLRWIFANGPGGHQTELSFARDSESDGWIGLAIVGQNETCSSRPIWLKLLASYRGGSNPEAIRTQWRTLLKHEGGHNTGLGHSRGGVMNPSIVNGLPISWKGDPSEPILRRKFGGVPIPGTNPPPPPGGDDGDGDDDGGDNGVIISGKIFINKVPYLFVRDPGYAFM